MQHNINYKRLLSFNRIHWMFKYECEQIIHTWCRFNYINECFYNWYYAATINIKYYKLNIVKKNKQISFLKCCQTNEPTISSFDVVYWANMCSIANTTLMKNDGNKAFATTLTSLVNFWLYINNLRCNRKCWMTTLGNHNKKKNK